MSDVVGISPTPVSPLPFRVPSARRLDELRQTTDPLADEAVRAVYDSGELENVNAILVQIVQNDGLNEDELPSELRHFFEASSQLPDWADFTKIEITQKLFIEHGLWMVGLLLTAALPECYLDKEGTVVLGTTGQLEKHIYRRVWETSQMIIHTLSPGALVPHDAHAKGIVVCQRVRLLHAAIRFLMRYELQEIPTREPRHLGDVLVRHRWPKERLGEPINQEDQSMALQTFCYVTGRGMQQLGLGLDVVQLDAWTHTWSVIGALMGMHEDLLPQTWSQAQAIYQAVKDRRMGESPGGQALMKAMLDFLGRLMPPGFQALPKQITWDLIGDEAARTLGIQLNVVERAGAGAALLILQAAGTLSQDFFFKHPKTRALQGWLFMEIIKTLWSLDRGWNRGLFHLPETLQEGWGLKLDPDLQPSKFNPKDGRKLRSLGRAEVPPATGLLPEAFQFRKIDQKILDYLQERIVPADPTPEELDRLGTFLMGELQRERHDLVRKQGTGTWVREGVDQLLRTREPEYLDQPEVPVKRKQRIVDVLDRLNRVVWTYERTFDALELFLQRIEAQEGRPARVLELAAGSCEFTLRANKIAEKRGLKIQMTGSDIVESYLEAARERARKKDIDCEFRRVDLLNLPNHAKDGYDVGVMIFVAHHFNPGMLARILAGAQKAFRHGLVVMDGHRSATLIASVPVPWGLLNGSLDFTHDAFISSRRFYAESELSLLAQLGVPEVKRTIRTSHPGLTEMTLDFQAKPGAAS